MGRVSKRKEPSAKLGRPGHFFPVLRLSGLQDGVANELSFQGITEGWACRFALGYALQEIGHLMNEAMFVANLQAWHPPLTHVRMVTICHMNCAPTPNAALIAMLEILQTVQIVQVPENGGMFTINLERIKCFMPSGVAGGLKRRKGAIFKAGKKSAGIIDSDAFDFA